MEAPINQYPNGLLGFLDIKAMGQNPSELGKMVLPIYDMTPHYLSARRQTRTTSIFQIPTNSWLDLGPGPGKCWIVESMWCSCPGALTGSVEAQMAIFRPQTASVATTIWVSDRQFKANGPPSGGANANGIVAAHAFATPFVLTNGQHVGVISTLNTSPFELVTLSACFTEVDA